MKVDRYQVSIRERLVGWTADIRSINTGKRIARVWGAKHHIMLQKTKAKLEELEAATAINTSRPIVLTPVLP